MCVADSSDSDHGSLHDDEEDKFCRLEESRACLEKELGEATFLQAYKIIQVFSGLVFNPTIFQESFVFDFLAFDLTAFWEAPWTEN